MLTLKELKEKIVEQVPEIDLIDILGLTTKDLVEAFEDEIEAEFDKSSILDEFNKNKGATDAKRK